MFLVFREIDNAIPLLEPITRHGLAEAFDPYFRVNVLFFVPFKPPIIVRKLVCEHPQDGQTSDDVWDICPQVSGHFADAPVEAQFPTKFDPLVSHNATSLAEPRMWEPTATNAPRLHSFGCCVGGVG